MKTVINIETVNKSIVNTAIAVGGRKYAEIPVSCFGIMPEYQRPLDGHERSIASKFDEKKFDPIQVSYRDGQFYIIDGQHRLAAARMVGKEIVPCYINEGMTFEQEAMAFGHQNELVKKLSTRDRMRALVMGGDAKATALKQICDEYGVNMIDREGKPILTGIQAAFKAYCAYGEGCVTFIFDVVQDAGWHHVDRAYSQDTVIALRNIYVAHKHDIDNTKANLVMILKPITLNLLKSKAVSTYVDRSPAAAMTALLESELARRAELMIRVEG